MAQKCIIKTEEYSKTNADTVATYKSNADAQHMARFAYDTAQLITFEWVCQSQTSKVSRDNGSEWRAIHDTCPDAHETEMSTKHYDTVRSKISIFTV